MIQRSRDGHISMKTNPGCRLRKGKITCNKTHSGLLSSVKTHGQCWLLHKDCRDVNRWWLWLYSSPPRSRQRTFPFLALASNRERPSSAGVLMSLLQLGLMGFNYWMNRRKLCERVRERGILINWSGMEGLIFFSEILNHFGYLGACEFYFLVMNLWIFLLGICLSERFCLFYFSCGSLKLLSLVLQNWVVCRHCKNIDILCHLCQFEWNLRKPIGLVCSCTFEICEWFCSWFAIWFVVENTLVVKGEMVLKISWNWIH